MPYAGSGNELYYEDIGEGHPILFIPGFGGVGSFWRSQMAFFKSRFRTITVDQRGAGASALSRQEYSLDQMTEDVLTVMNAAGVNKAVLVGHSTGGAIAQMLAFKTPERVSGILLSSTWCKPGNYFRRVFEFRRTLLELGQTALFHQAGVFFRYPPSYSETHDSAFDSIGSIDVEITIARINAILRTDLSEIIDRINVPALVLAADDDCLIPQYMSEVVAQRIAGAKYVTLDRGGHFLPETRGDDYNALLGGFLERLGLASGESQLRQSAE